MFQLLAIDQVLGEARRRRYGFRQELECNESLETGILGLVDHAHTATELLKDAIVGDGLADHVDGNLTLGRNPTLCPKLSQTDIGGVAGSIDLGAVGPGAPSQAAVRMATTREVVMVW